MAYIKAAKAGAWSDTATWTGGVVPGADDDVLSNNYTVTIDASISVKSLSNLATGGANAGGKFQVNSAGEKTISLSSGITPSHYTATTGLIEINNASADVTITAAISDNGQKTVNILAGMARISSGIIGTGSSGHVALSGSGSVTITGNITGGSVSGACGLYNGGSGSVTITGNVTGGSNSNAYGVYNSGSGSVTVTGNVTGGSVSGAYGVYNASLGKIMCYGTATSTDALGIYSPSGGSMVLFTKSETSSTGLTGVLAARWACVGPAAEQSVMVRAIPEQSVQPFTFTTLSRYGENLPAEKDVRLGLVYGPDNALTGSMIPAHAKPDIYDGPGYIQSTVEAMVSGTPTLYGCRVALFDQRRRLLVDEVESDPITGVYRFDNLPMGVKFMAVADEETDTLRAGIASGLFAKLP